MSVVMSHNGQTSSENTAPAPPNAAGPFVVRTLILDKPEPGLQAVCLALGLQAKNLYNSTHFAVHNALSAYCRSETSAAATPRRAQASPTECLSNRHL